MPNNLREKISEINKIITARSSNPEIKKFGYCVFTPVPLNRISKEQAKELKKLCQEADPEWDFLQLNWIKTDEVPFLDPRRWRKQGDALDYNCFKDTLPEFIKELERIENEILSEVELMKEKGLEDAEQALEEEGLEEPASQHHAFPNKTVPNLASPIVISAEEIASKFAALEKKIEELSAEIIKLKAEKLERSAKIDIADLIAQIQIVPKTLN